MSNLTLKDSNMSDEEKEERKKCTRCKVNLLLKDFNIKTSGEYSNQCTCCLEYNKKNREKNKCPHNRQKSTCKECGGASICIHNRRKSRCKECGGSSICIHNRQKSTCKECDICGYIRNITSSRIYHALNGNKDDSTIEYLGCTIEFLKEHLEKQFVEGMSWENYGSEWHIDHIIPIKYENPTLEKVIQRLHWKNTQPLWAEENMSKGNRFIGKKEN